MWRGSFVGRPASQGEVVLFFSDHGGGRHWPRSCVDSLFTKKTVMFRRVGGVHDFGGADGCEIAVSLIGDDDSSGTGAF